MEIKNLSIKTKCDIQGCKNLASKNVIKKLENKTVLCLCDDCVKTLYNAIGETLVPKGIEAPFKNLKKVRAKNG